MEKTTVFAKGKNSQTNNKVQQEFNITREITVLICETQAHFLKPHHRVHPRRRRIDEPLFWK